MNGNGKVDDGTGMVPCRDKSRRAGEMGGVWVEVNVSLDCPSRPIWTHAMERIQRNGLVKNYVRDFGSVVPPQGQNKGGWVLGQPPRRSNINPSLSKRWVGVIIKRKPLVQGWCCGWWEKWSINCRDGAGLMKFVGQKWISFLSGAIWSSNRSNYVRRGNEQSHAHLSVPLSMVE